MEQSAGTPADGRLAAGTDALRTVRAELRAAGARPRTRAHALTASERRIAEMAARGDTNKQIAQALVITPETVENHLGRVYMKLDVHARTALSAALAADAPAAISPISETRA